MSAAAYLSAKGPPVQGRTRPARIPGWLGPAAAAGFAAAFAGPAVATAITAAGLVVVGRVDLRERRIPTPMVLGMGGVVAVALAATAATAGEWDRLASALLFAAGVTALFALGWLVKPEGLGLGDVRLAFVVTLTAGWHGLDVVLALWWWTSVAALVGALVVRGRGVRHIPLAPAAAAGWAVALVLGT